MCPSFTKLLFWVPGKSFCRSEEAEKETLTFSLRAYSVKWTTFSGPTGESWTEKKKSSATAVNVWDLLNDWLINRITLVYKTNASITYMYVFSKGCWGGHFGRIWTRNHKIGPVPSEFCRHDIDLLLIVSIKSDYRNIDRIVYIFDGSKDEYKFGWRTILKFRVIDISYSCAWCICTLTRAIKKKGEFLFLSPSISSHVK